MGNIKGPLCSCKHNAAMHNFGHSACAYCPCNEFDGEKEDPSGFINMLLHSNDV